MSRSIQTTAVTGAVLIAMILVNPRRVSAETQDPPTPPPLQSTQSSWEVLDQRQGQGEQCLVCRQQIYDGDVVEVRYKGRTFYVAAGEMFRLFGDDPQRYFGRIQARSALFDEAGVGVRAMSLPWLLFGLYTLIGLIVGAVCGYLAVSKGLEPAPWFFAGLVGNGAVLAVLLNAQSRADTAAPDGIPPGLTKVPTTHAPRPCGVCGQGNHPSAARCHGCGAVLDPVVESEVARA